MQQQIEKEKHAVQRILLDPYGVLETLFFFIQVVTGWVSVTVEVFLRFKFGERYLGWLRLYFSYTLLAWFVFFNVLANNIGGFVMNVLGLFVLASIAHRVMIYKMNRDQERWHSYSPGIGWLELLFKRYSVSSAVIYRFLEPLLVFVVGFISLGIDRAMGLWLVIAAFSLIIQRQIAYSHERNAVLDAIDGQIESEYLSAVLVDEKPIRETAGFTMMAADKNMPVEKRKDLVSMFQGLDPALRQTMDDAPEAAAA